VTVGDVTPLVSPISGGTLNAGTTYTASGSFVDPSNDTWTATVDYGDGSGVQPLTLSGKNFSLSHLYTAPGNHAVTVKVIDDDGTTGTQTAGVMVNAEGTQTAISAPSVTYGQDGLVTVTVSAVDSFGGTPTGSVQLSVNGGTALTGTLQNGSYTFDLGVLPAGTYGLSATYALQNGYDTSGNTGTLTVNQATPMVSFTGSAYDSGTNTYAFTYNGSPQGAVASTAAGGTWNYTYYVGSPPTGNGSSTAPTDFGTYTVVAVFSSSDTNYTGASIQATIQIAKAPATLSVAAGGTYNQLAQSAVGTALSVVGMTTVNGTWSCHYYVGAGTSGTDLGATAPVNAGTNTVVATFTSTDSNYSDGTFQAPLVVQQAPITVMVASDIMLKGNNPPAFSGSIQGVLPGDVVTATYSTTATSSSPVGTCAITATLGGGSLANYAPTIMQGTLYIVTIGTDPNGGTADGVTGPQGITFWDNSGNSAFITCDDLKDLRGLNLVSRQGYNFDPTTAAQLQSWLNSGDATNMAYWLSCRLAVVELNKLTGLIQSTNMVYAGQLLQYNAASHPISGLDSGGFIDIADLIAASNAALAANPTAYFGSAAYNYELALVQVLEGATGSKTNNDFVQQSVPDV
jgi:hypothetical protein